MYGWVWRKLPGGVPGKLLGCAVLLFATLALLFLVVFPWAGPKLPFNHVTVDQTPTPRQTTTVSPGGQSPVSPGGQSPVSPGGQSPTPAVPD